MPSLISKSAFIAITTWILDTRNYHQSKYRDLMTSKPLSRAATAHLEVIVLDTRPRQEAFGTKMV